MHIDIVPNRGSAPAVLLRESYREGKAVRKRTLANLSSLPMSQVDSLRRVLKGQRLAAIDDIFEVSRSWHHGHVEAVLKVLDRLDFDSLLASRPSRERSLVKAMVAARVLAPKSKLATTRWWDTTTLPDELGVQGADEEELYSAMDWLAQRQEAIERRLGARHLNEGGLVLYDLTSTYFEGKSCPLAAHGYSRDGRPEKLQVTFGVVSNRDGCPVACSVYPGNTNDAQTVLPELQRLRTVHGVQRVVLVGDRGMITEQHIDVFAADGAVAWITALRSGAIRKLHDSGALQMGLFDERNLFEFSSPDHPGERLVACRNLELQKLRNHKREELIAATRAQLDRIKRRIERGRLRDRGEIGVAVGRVLNSFKVAKHFRLHIKEGSFRYEVREDRVAAEAAIDGVYVIRTSLRRKQMDAEDVVRSYKRLAEVERAFRTLKTIDLKVRPIHHWRENRVRAHIFLCLLAYYVEWHLLQAWRSLLFADEDQAAKRTRDPVAPAKRSDSAEQKVASHRLPDGSSAHSFRTILDDLAAIVRNLCHRKGADAKEATFVMTTMPSAKQRQALDLLDQVSPRSQNANRA